MQQQYVIVAVIIILYIKSVTCDVTNNYINECNLSDSLKKEIASYGPIVENIISIVVNGSLKSAVYNELAKFVDRFGARFSSTQNLENAIDYMVDVLQQNNLDNVHTEEVQLPNWARGKELAMLLEPRLGNLSILGLGTSIGTAPEGLQAEVLVVKSFDELNAKAKLARGKIIVFNQNFVSYGATVVYRVLGATAASKVGGVASLIRSITPFSMYIPHTGMQSYGQNVTKIPTACITVEDAEMLHRMQNRGQKIRILLKMDARNLPQKTSRNTVAEVQGRTAPHKIVVVSGHLDSWDVGQGAMDDGGGAFISWMSLVVLKRLDLQPKRTVRAVLWTGEELGLIGAQQYKEAHANESDNLNFIMESDEGTFNPVGINYSAGKQGGCILEEVMKLLAPLNATLARKESRVGSDIALWTGQGFPGASLLTEASKYFWFHHTQADRIEVEDPAELDKCTGVWASIAYVLADLSIDFPREILK